MYVYLSLSLSLSLYMYIHMVLHVLLNTFIIIKMLCRFLTVTIHMYLNIPVSAKHTLFVQAFPLQSSSRCSHPPTDSVLQKLVVPRVFFAGGVFFHRHRYHFHNIPCQRQIHQRKHLYLNKCNTLI